MARIKIFDVKKRFYGDSNFHSIMKSISYRIVGTISTIVISYIITGEVAMALSIGSIEVFAKMFIYYLHERMWNRISIYSRLQRRKKYQHDYQI